MREDEISRYTADGDVLDMMDFRDIPADELAGTEDYIDAQATVAEGIDVPRCPAGQRGH